MLLSFSGNVGYLHFLSFVLPTFLKMYFALTSLEFSPADLLFSMSCELFVTKKSPGFGFLPPLPDSHAHENPFSFFCCSVGSQSAGGWPCCLSGYMLLWPNSTWVLPGAFPYLPLWPILLIPLVCQMFPALCSPWVDFKAELSFLPGSAAAVSW